MSIVWLVQILTSLGFEIYKNWKIQKIMVAMETVRQITKFFIFVFITRYKLKMGKVSEISNFLSVEASIPSLIFFSHPLYFLKQNIH